MECSSFSVNLFKCAPGKKVLTINHENKLLVYKCWKIIHLLLVRITFALWSLYLYFDFYVSAATVLWSNHSFRDLYFEWEPAAGSEQREGEWNLSTNVYIYFFQWFISWIMNKDLIEWDSL